MVHGLLIPTTHNLQTLKLTSLRLNLVLLLLLVHLNFCLCINREGLALLRFRDRLVSDPFDALSTWTEGDSNNPCSWFGIQCSNGTVVALTLTNLGLEGTLSPQLGQLTSIESIILRNNSFSSYIPKEIPELNRLKILDLGQNNFTGPLPFEVGFNPHLAIILLDNNHLLGYVSSEQYKLSEFQVYETRITTTSSSGNNNDFVRRRLLLAESPKESQLKSNRTSPTMSPISSSSSLLFSHLSPKDGIKKGSSSSLLSPKHSPASPPPHALPNKTRALPPRSSSKVPPANPPRSAAKLSPFPSPSLSPLLSPYSSPSPSPLLPPAPSPTPLLSPFTSSSSRSHPPRPTPTIPFSLGPVSLRQPANSTLDNSTSSPRSSHKVLVWASAAGASLFLILTAVGIFICRNSKVVTVKPWATGLSGQLRKALITGVPKLKRSELETACEDFSNIIGTLEDSVVYKGTLSNGTEIAVVSSMVKSHQQWSKSLEAQFKKKVETLSKISHKNFVNLIGYCQEEIPFTRMMIFEYAPSGTLFEHLHIKEAERLDWSMRLRVIMGMAYCLDHMHQLNPPISHRDLQSSSVYLTEDYAAKVSDLSFWNEVTTAANKMRSPSMQLFEASSLSSSSMTTNTESNVQSFGVLLLEVITGRIPYSTDNGSIEAWVWEYLRLDKLSNEIIDPTLLDDTFQEEEMQKLFGVIKDCVQTNPKVRPAMRDVTVRLKDITGVEPDGATPRVSPLWWAELEILSTEGA